MALRLGALKFKLGPASTFSATKKYTNCRHSYFFLHVYSMTHGTHSSLGYRLLWPRGVSIPPWGLTRDTVEVHIFTSAIKTEVWGQVGALLEIFQDRTGYVFLSFYCGLVGNFVILDIIY